MDEQVTGLLSGEAAAPEESGLAERLIREEFAETTHAHRAWFQRAELASVFDETAQVPIVAAAPADHMPVTDPGAIHEEFAEPSRPPRFRSHRAGMLAGLGVVGALLAVLVLLAPGSGKPRLPAQSVHDVSPISASGPKTEAATTPSTAAPSSTTSSAPVSATTTTPAHQGVTTPSTVTYVYLPGTTTPAATPTTSAPAATPTTSPPPPPTTTTTTTTPPTTTTSCLLGIVCN